MKITVTGTDRVSRKLQSLADELVRTQESLLKQEARALCVALGAVTLLNVLIRSGTAVNVASLFYLTPISTAVIAWAIFGEKLTLTAAAGMLLAVSGVYLVARAK